MSDSASPKKSDARSPRWTMERAASDPAPLLHPLAGSNFRTFLSQYLGHGDYTARSRKQRLICWISQILRLPWTALEQLQWGKTIRNHQLSAPPIFLIGHWRSGTTHLHNLLSRDPQFGYIDFGQTAMPWDMMGKKVELSRKIINRELPETRGYDNVKLSLDEPQEEEMALGNLNPVGYYSIYYFPREMETLSRQALFFEGLDDEQIAGFEKAYEFLVRKLGVVNEGKRLLFKNPPSTTRIGLIKKLFPDAKFVHIVRNPYPVYRSSIGKFPRLYNAFAWQEFSDIDTHRFTIDIYEELMKRYLRDRETLSPEDLFETTYEKITEDPLGEIGRIYDALGIGGKESGLEHIGKYVASISNYQPNVHRMRRQHIEEIQDRWRFSFEHWGYPLDPPGDIEVID
ncbi:MAG: sulfotransferase [Verrucomicrobiae bacterium]|nr:sulfotransferase [Verrucomicrobiae bacterium]